MGYKKPVGFSLNYVNKTLTLYTDNPGSIIGKNGQTVEKIKNQLNQNYAGIWNVEFVSVDNIIC